jgi:hypothetical protein
MLSISNPERFGDGMKHGRFLQLMSLTVCIAIPVRVQATESKSLNAISAFAQSLLREKELGGPMAYCSKTNYCQVHACSGESRNDTRILVKGDGTVELDRYRNVREDVSPLPGAYVGTYPKEKWRVLLSDLSKMTIDPGKPGAALRPPPGPTETISELVLSDGKKSVSYSMAGFESESIDKGFAAPNILAQYATDTVWAIQVSLEKVKSMGSTFTVSAKLQSKGKRPVRISWPDSSEPHGCGRGAFRWHINTPQAQELGFTIQNAIPIRSQKPELPWTRISASKSATASLLFQAPSDAEPGRKAGRLHEFGILVKEDSAAIPITLFSSEIPF